MIHSIPPTVLKENKDSFAPLLTQTVNNSISQNEFANDLRLVDIAPSLKGMKLRISKIFDAQQHCPPSKVFEPPLYYQMTGFAYTFLVPYFCGFRKGFNTQHALVRLMETCMGPPR